MFLFASVILFTRVEGVCLCGRSASRGGGPQPGGSASRGGWADPPEIHGILWDKVKKRAVRILLECFLVLSGPCTFSLNIVCIVSVVNEHSASDIQQVVCGQCQVPALILSCLG